MRQRVNLLGMGIDTADFGQAVTRIDGFVRSRRPHQVVTVNVDFLRLGEEDASFRTLINTADLVVPDGMPLLWAARLLGTPLPERIAGVDLLEACAQLAAAQGYRLFLLGAAPGVAQTAAAVLSARHPGLQIAGTESPPRESCRGVENARLVQRIRAARADLLFVAFGAPRQDQWIREHAAQLGVPVCMGVGGAFDILAGRVPRAPQWMQHYGLEWLYRCLCEPRRLWRRYFVEDLPIFLRLMAQGRTPAEESAVPGLAPEGASDEAASWTHGETLAV